MGGINYLYYGALFFLLLITTTSSVFTKQPMLGSKMFFWLYAVGQALFEVALLCLVGEWIRKNLRPKWFWLFAGLTFWAFIWHSLDYIMDRILDLSLFSTIGFVLDESFENFLFLIEASGVPLWIWIMAFTIFALVPLLGAGIYALSNWMSQKKPWAIEQDTLLQLVFCIPAGLLFWDVVGSKAIDPDSYNTFTTSLPWKRTFQMPKSVVFETTSPLLPIPSEQKIQAEIDQIEFAPLAHKPNIYIFVTESLRNDFLNEKTAPNLIQFQKQNWSANLSLSNANSTQISWFSIFHSQFPLHWSHVSKSNWNLGSPPLAIFKKLGYEIHVLSSAELRFYGMEKLLFGKDRYLLDSITMFPHAAPKQAWESDLETVQFLEKNMKKEGQLIIVFWDTTHFDYSWPKANTAPFTPFAKELAYFNAFQTKKNKEQIKNRYRNAVHYMDSLFGKFLSFAPSDAIIAFMGDHGEEFFDHGHLFHLSHLTQEQISVPIFLKLPGYGQKTLPILTQIDVMPTILSALTHQTYSFLKGESVLESKKFPFVLSARFNASRTPQEFAIQNALYKAIIRFDGSPFETNRLRLVSLRERGDEPLRRCPEKCDDWLQEQFGPMLERLFPKID